MVLDHEKAAQRLSILASHLIAGDKTETNLQRAHTRAFEDRPAPGGGAGTLTVTDVRTGKVYQIPISEGGTIKGSDLGKIKAGGDGVGLRTYDPGYVNTAAVVSKICFIDGDKGILRYRGYPIEQIAERADFLETAFCLLYGELPTASQLSDWSATVMRHSVLPLTIVHVIEALPAEAHPMGVLMAGISALGTLHPHQNPAIAGEHVYKSRHIQDAQIVRLLAQVPAIAAMAYHRATGKQPALPNEQLSYAENFLYMLDAGANTDYRPHPVYVRAMDVMFILHAEHEMNCSTAAVRHLASSGVDVYTAVAGAVGALYGPLHGGANEAVLKMLARIKSVEAIPAFLEGVKNKKEKLFGFGHRVYKNFDPRAKLIQHVAEQVFAVAGRDPLIDIAVALQNAARNDEYFVSRKLYPNVDFFSGLVYRAMGFPPSFFTVLFAVPRIAGYLSHWRESLSDPDQRIARPQQDYQGVWLRTFPPIDSRPAAKGQTPMPPSNEQRRKMAGSAWV